MESKAAQKVLESVDIQQNESVLEVGVGTGLVLGKIVRHNEHGFSVGIDISPQMLAKARKRLNPLKDLRNFSLQLTSAYDLPFENETFDGLISYYILGLLPGDNFVRILEEFKRVLKPDGWLVLASMSPLEMEPFMKKAGFEIKNLERISQHTFPSQIIKAKNA